MIKPIILYGIKCDRCGIELSDFDDHNAWEDESTAESEAEESEWHTSGSRHYCPCCYTIDESGDLRVKPRIPDYVRKIDLFMNRVASCYPSHIVEEDQYYSIVGHTFYNKKLEKYDEDWIRSFAGEYLIGIYYAQIRACNMKYSILLKKHD